MIKLIKKTFLFAFLLLAFGIVSFAQTGIGTTSPNPTSVVELNASDRGFKGPSIALTSRTDQATIPSPANGLVVFNTANAGSSPNEVVAGRYYFWDGTAWQGLPGNLVIEELIRPRIFYLRSSASQNSPSSNSNEFQVTFQTSDVVLNQSNIATLQSNGSIRINVSGLYEVSAFINYDPNGSSSNRALQNLKIQKAPSATSSSWQDIDSVRGAWGAGSASDLKTLIIPLTAVRLEAGEFIRLFTQNPFTTDSSVQGTGEIRAPDSSPISKSLRLQLIEFAF
ncbi:hypothetical protein ACFOUP_11130 [Belliella kenyensis]|uniref:PEP-CTERM sorting domain-containing protein n=1 Tax=Belliella kenyensis TaxID=1472724 RepID=A0ABV8EP66_9BACT|nr:hypothetical protein [Belliella kenyensis]MCH7403724.1 hypothetical protein [Belliella kenyensis]MDN3602487.1 hypothetical protein [Belliella kenyensis]